MGDASQKSPKKDELSPGCGCLMVIIILLFSMCSVMRDNDRPVKTQSSLCYDYGYRVGRCSAMALNGLKCDPADDIVVPERCRGKDETLKGISAGSKSVLK